MSRNKRTFTHAERYAVFTVHGEKCYLCHAPINLRTMEVDHVIPESLRGNPPRLAGVLKLLGRQEDFDLNSFANWMPACCPCNRAKQATIFEPSGIVQLALQTAERKASKAAELAQNTVRDVAIAKALNLLQQQHEAGELPQWVLDELLPLVGFHVQQRNKELDGKPIWLTPSCIIEAQAHFVIGSAQLKATATVIPWAITAVSDLKIGSATLHTTNEAAKQSDQSP